MKKWLSVEEKTEGPRMRRIGGAQAASLSISAASWNASAFDMHPKKSPEQY